MPVVSLCELKWVPIVLVYLCVTLKLKYGKPTLAASQNATGDILYIDDDIASPVSQITRLRTILRSPSCSANTSDFSKISNTSFKFSNIKVSVCTDSLSTSVFYKLANSHTNLI